MILFKLFIRTVAAVNLIGLVSGGVMAKDSNLNDRILKAHATETLNGLHSVLVMHKGKVIAEQYFDGVDQNWGKSLGIVTHGRDTLHDLRSVTKSITSLLYGIALSEGLVPQLDASLIAQFPKYRDLAKDPERQKITIQHALSMKMGTDWDENLPYSDPRNSEIAMELAKDRYRFVLDRPMINEPGDWWVYNGGATAIIARLIENGVGKPIDSYAREALFAPLGITEFEWAKGADGTPSAASGLRLKIHDLAKIGRLILDNGQWNGKQIVPANWLSLSFKPYAKLRDGLRYGLFWWLSSEGTPAHWIAGFGNGGQRLTISPRAGLIVVIFAGNYNQPDAWRVPVTILRDIIDPARLPN